MGRKCLANGLCCIVCRSPGDYLSTLANNISRALKDDSEAICRATLKTFSTDSRSTGKMSWRQFGRRVRVDKTGECNGSTGL